MSKLKDKQPLYQMLLDDELRRKTYGQKMMVIDDVAVDGGPFNEVDWENIHFKEVDFYGRFAQGKLKNITFENCRFLDAQFFSKKMEDVTFIKCKTKGQAYIMARGTAVVFEDCDFTDQPDKNNNHWGAIEINGEVLFKNCKAHHIDLGAEHSATYDGCHFDDMELDCGEDSYDANKQKFADVTIKNCVLKGRIGMAASTLNTLVIEDTDVGTGILFPGTVREGVFLERVKGNFFTADADEPIKMISIRDCEFRSVKGGNGSLRVKGSKRPMKSEKMLIHNVKAGIGEKENAGCYFQMGDETAVANVEAPYVGFALQGHSLVIDGLKTVEVAFSNIEEGATMQKPALILRNIAVSGLVDLKGVHAPSLSINGFRAGTLDLSETRITKLTIQNATTESVIDLTNAVIESGDLSGMVGGQKIKVITTGSNVTVKDGKLVLLPVKKK